MRSAAQSIRSSRFCKAGLAWGVLMLARAAQAEPIGTVVVDARRTDADLGKAREDASLSLVTVIDARRPSASQASVADLIAGEAGVRVRSRGGLGAFTSVSLRGSEEGEVTVLLDGVPLSRAASGAIDLSTLPADGLERIEIYRGAPPIELGGEAIGGVINLVSRRAGKTTWSAALGGGSFGARSASLQVGAPVAKGKRASETTSAQLSAAYRGATGDFSYFDNAGTLFNSADDRIGRRRNNDFDQGNLDLTLDRGGARPFHLGVHGFMKSQGAPGLATAGKETEHARLSTGRLLVSGSAGRRGRVDFGTQASLLWERVHFENPLGEAVGPFGPAVSEGESITASLVPHLAAPVGKLQLWSAQGELKLEHRQPYDLLRPGSSLRPAVRGLFALAAADELALWRDRLSIYLGLRFDARASSLLTGRSGDVLPDQDRFDWFLSPRLNLRLRVHRLLTLRASGGRYVRFPTLLEQFGDGAFVLGRATLSPESAWGGELAATLRGSTKRVGGGLEAAVFGRRVADLIAFIPGGNTVTPINVGDAAVVGVEARGDVAIAGRVELSCAYTFLDARDRSRGAGAGHRLPGRAPHALDARVMVIGGPFRLGYELDFLSAVPRDPQELNVLPARVLHAIVASFRYGRFELELEVRNLADTRIVQLPLGGSARAGETAPYPLVDFYNFPLPGRAVYATARIAP
jgi:outer membrane receptor protein involved in Fe transport